MLHVCLVTNIWIAVQSIDFVYILDVELTYICKVNLFFWFLDIEITFQFVYRFATFFNPLTLKQYNLMQSFLILFRATYVDR